MVATGDLTAARRREQSGFATMIGAEIVNEMLRSVG